MSSQTILPERLREKVRLAQSIEAKVDALHEFAVDRVDDSLRLVLEIAREILRLSTENNYLPGLIEGKKLLGIYHYRKANFKEAISELEHGLELCKSQNMPLLEADLRNYLGVCCQATNQPEKALALLEGSLNVYRKDKSKKSKTKEAACLLNLANVLTYQSRWEHALKTFNRALELSEKIQDKRLAAQSLIRIGAVYRTLNKPDKARPFLERYLHYATQQNSYGELANAHSEMGSLLYQVNDFAGAETHMLKSIEYFQKVGIIEQQGTCYLNLSRIALQTDSVSKAFEYLSQGIYNCLEVGSARSIPAIERSLGNFQEILNRIVNENERNSRFLGKIETELRSITMRMSYDKEEAQASIERLVAEMQDSSSEHKNASTNILRLTSPEFLSKLNSTYPDLSHSELQVCAYIRFNHDISSKHIAEEMHVSKGTVDTYRSRIRRKMKLPRSVSLRDHIKRL